MASVQNVLVRGNLGADFALDATNKLVHVNIDGNTIKRNGTTGVLSAISGISTDAGQILETGTDGLPLLTDTVVKSNETVTTFSASPAGDGVGPTLTYVNEAGTTVNVDLASLVTDLNVDGGSYDPATTILTLTQLEGPAITVNLGELAKSNVSNTQSASISGNGSTASPLAVDVNVSASAGNAVSVNADGLFVAAGGGLTVDNTNHNVANTITAGVLSSEVVIDSSVTGNMLLSNPDSGISVQPVKAANASDGSLAVTVSGDATIGQTVTGSVNLSATTGNLVIKKSDGIYVTPVQISNGNGINLGATVTAGVETITAAVVVDSATANTNFASVSSDGVLVDATVVFDCELQDIFNTHLCWTRAGTSASPN